MNSFSAKLKESLQEAETHGIQIEKEIAQLEDLLAQFKSKSQPTDANNNINSGPLGTSGNKDINSCDELAYDEEDALMINDSVNEFSTEHEAELQQLAAKIEAVVSNLKSLMSTKLRLLTLCDQVSIIIYYNSFFYQSFKSRFEIHAYELI